MRNILAVVATLLITTNVAAGDAAAGKKLYKKVNCTMCHKADGMGKAKNGKVKITKGPRIAGLDESYIVAQMTAIKSKARKTKATSMMYAKIKKLSDADIKNLATYVSKLGPKFKGMLE